MRSADDFIRRRLDVRHLQRSFLSRQDGDPLLRYRLCEAEPAAFFPIGEKEKGKSR